MTGYDAFVTLVIITSAAAGFVRGGVREIVTLISFAVAVFISLIALPFTGPVGRSLIDPAWVGSILAVLVVFLVVYFGLRLAGSALKRGAHEHTGLGGLDRVLGVVIGTLRALVLVGAIHLVIAGAMPGERTPRWLTGSATYPVSAAAAKAIQAVLPNIGRGVDAVTPVIDSSVRRGFSDEGDLPPPHSDNTSPPTPPDFRSSEPHDEPPSDR